MILLFYIYFHILKNIGQLMEMYPEIQFLDSNPDIQPELMSKN